jgi:hypothetical protein
MKRHQAKDTVLEQVQRSWRSVVWRMVEYPGFKVNMIYNRRRGRSRQEEDKY